MKSKEERITIGGVILNTGIPDKGFKAGDIRVTKLAAGRFDINFPLLKQLHGFSATPIGGVGFAIVAGGMVFSGDNILVSDVRMYNESGGLIDVSFFIMASGIPK